ncbi:uncharacterized protein [Dermacentor albipictus]|uniref:uncharacterized protein n=1 Tax=Dermacentor albipictus TaxID=60249 RepID=UPI0038FD198F
MFSLQRSGRPGRSGDCRSQQGKQLHEVILHPGIVPATSCSEAERQCRCATVADDKAKKTKGCKPVLDEARFTSWHPGLLPSTQHAEAIQASHRQRTLGTTSHRGGHAHAGSYYRSDRPLGPQLLRAQRHWLIEGVIREAGAEYCTREANSCFELMCTKIPSCSVSA